MKRETVLLLACVAAPACLAYNPECPPDDSNIVGHTAVSLDLRPELIRAHEAPIGNLVADAYFAAGPGAELALVNSGAIRHVGCHIDGFLDPGPIRMGQLREMLPFENQVVVITVTGKDILAALEWSVGRLGDPGPAGLSGRFLQVSHLRMAVDCSARPADGDQKGSRVEAWLAHDDGSIVGIDPAASYDVATNRFLAEGGDGFKSLKVTPSHIEPTEDVVLVAQYVQSLGTITPTVGERILLTESCNQREP